MITEVAGDKAPEAMRPRLSHDQLMPGMLKSPHNINIIIIILIKFRMGYFYLWYIYY